MFMEAELSEAFRVNGDAIDFRLKPVLATSKVVQLATGCLARRLASRRELDEGSSRLCRENNLGAIIFADESNMVLLHTRLCRSIRRA
jgi:hypothetical protein